MRTIIGFVGKGPYREVVYSMGDKECRSKYPFYCLYKWFSPDQIYVISTKEGFEKNKEIENLIPEIKKVVINTPKRSEDVWEIYEKVSDLASMGDELIVDVTYSFRHIPLLLYSTLLYLREIKGVDIYGIYYGAFEAMENQKVPIFDIMGSVEVVRWLYAMNDMVRYGRSQRIREIAEELKSKNEDKATYGILVKFSGALKKVSDSLYLNQNLDTLKGAKSVRDILDERKENLEKIKKEYPPVGDILSLTKKIGRMGVDSYEILTKDVLEKLLLIAEYQTDINLVGEALETLREWLVSYVICITGIGRENWLERDARVSAEKALGVLRAEVIGDGTNNMEKTPHYYALKNKPYRITISLNELGKLWDRVIQMRNPIAHAGMSKNELKYNNILKGVREILKKYKELINMC